MKNWLVFISAVPTALATALDIGFSNESLRFISVSFMTMVSFRPVNIRTVVDKSLPGNLLRVQNPRYITGIDVLRLVPLCALPRGGGSTTMYLVPFPLQKSGRKCTVTHNQTTPI